LLYHNDDIRNSVANIANTIGNHMKKHRKR